MTHTAPVHRTLVRCGIPVCVCVCVCVCVYVERSIQFNMWDREYGLVGMGVSGEWG